ncbi:tyrosine-protein phosphatase non-receptor type 4-like [Dysidea avara]|uniref:tyrosine-protein phosphatase non-receptor type 4-like n=1 Tax=Dysidea avara TaxID=196820 RepID=UPI0033312270
MASIVRRLGSMRRTSNTITRSPTTDTGAEHSDRSNKYLKCNVIMLDDSYKTFEVERNSQASVLLSEVFDFMDIVEQDYFGLTYDDDGKMKWLNPLKTIKKQLKSHFSDHVCTLELRVKFYVSSPAKVQEEFTRYQFFLQIKRDIFQNKLPCSFEEAAILASYIIQSELGDYNSEEHPDGYVSEYRFVPNQTEELETRIAELHVQHLSLTPADAEYNFLMHAKDMDFYGIELFRAQDPHGLELMVGITHMGVVVFHHKRKVNTFEWTNIHQVTYKRRRFTMHITPEQSSQTHVSFILETSELCKEIWKTCIEHHTFFKLHKPPEPQKRTFFRRGSKFTYSGRTERQAMQDYKDKVRERRIENITFERTPSNRYKKRTIPAQRLSDTDPVTTAAVKRAHTIKEFRGVKPALEPRRLSWQDFSSFGHDTTTNGEVTAGQSSTMKPDLDNTGGGGGQASTDFFDMVPSTGPTEYYDERNAQDETVGNFSMDELASDGLLLTRIEGGELGRFGFNIRGGVDQEMPIMVSRVVPDGAAAKANPSLNEGDQILYINGHSMADQTHEQAVMMIKASKELRPCELVLVIKPHDLSRINPLPMDQSTAQSDNPEENVKISLQQLRESLRDGTALLQFDQLYRRKPGMAALACKQPHNIAKNRYRDISAYDATRVKLLDGPDYINANYVNMELVKTHQVNRYIAAQGPMQHTSRDFWQMIWEQESTLIIMLTLTTEAGKVKCCKYWPDVKSTSAFGPYEVRCVSEQQDQTYITRYFTLRNIKMKQERRILQLQYISWPDHGVPDKALEFLNFVQHVRLEREGMEEPTIVHCSAGIGRTGVLMAVETALCMLECMEPVNPLDIVRVMRNQRGMLIQTPAQYKFVCESILRAYEEGYVDDPNNSLTNNHNLSGL